MEKSELISIILPTYNEKVNVVTLIESIGTVLSDWNYEILLVDDNSQDGTYQIVKDLQNDYVRTFIRKDGKSLGKSIRYGLESARGSKIVVMDSDLNHRADYLPFMIGSLAYYDCVIASRFLYGGGMGPDWSNKVHNCLSWLFNLLIRVTLGTSVTDSLYGYFAIKRSVLDEISYDDIFWGYGDYCIRLMYYLQKIEINILQFPAVNGSRIEGLGNRSFISVLFHYTYATIFLAIKNRLFKR